MRNFLAALLFVCVSGVVRAAEMDWNQPSALNAIVRSMTALKDGPILPLAATPSAASMPIETANYLRSIGIDPESKDVVSVYAEGPVTTEYNGDEEIYSLDTMAAQKMKNRIVTFIGTRLFIRRLKTNFAGTPKTNYDPMYLTPEERPLAARKFQ